MCKCSAVACLQLTHLQSGSVMCASVQLLLVYSELWCGLIEPLQVTECLTCVKSQLSVLCCLICVKSQLNVLRAVLQNPCLTCVKSQLSVLCAVLQTPWTRRCPASQRLRRTCSPAAAFVVLMMLPVPVLPKSSTLLTLSYSLWRRYGVFVGFLNVCGGGGGGGEVYCYFRHMHILSVFFQLFVEETWHLSVETLCVKYNWCVIM